MDMADVVQHAAQLAVQRRADGALKFRSETCSGFVFTLEYATMYDCAEHLTYGTVCGAHRVHMCRYAALTRALAQAGERDCRVSSNVALRLTWQPVAIMQIGDEGRGLGRRALVLRRGRARKLRPCSNGVNQGSGRQ